MLYEVITTIGIFAGASPLSLRMGIRVESSQRPISVCTSSGTVGHSLSLGKADAVSVVSDSCSLADAAATSIGNRVTSKAHIQSAIDFGKHIEGVRGIVVIIRITSYNVCYTKLLRILHLFCPEYIPYARAPTWFSYCILLIKCLLLPVHLPFSSSKLNPFLI